MPPLHVWLWQRADTGQWHLNIGVCYYWSLGEQIRSAPVLLSAKKKRQSQTFSRTIHTMSAQLLDSIVMTPLFCSWILKIDKERLPQRIVSQYNFIILLVLSKLFCARRLKNNKISVCSHSSLKHWQNNSSYHAPKMLTISAGIFNNETFADEHNCYFSKSIRKTYLDLTIGQENFVNKVQFII